MIRWPEKAKHISILTRPEGRVLQGWPEHGFSRYTISILTRPEGRVLLG